MTTSVFCWQPIAAVPFYFRVRGDLSEILPFLRPIFGRQQIGDEALQGALKEDGTRLFEWQIEHDTANEYWKAIPADGSVFESEVTESSKPNTFATQLEYAAVLRLFYHLDKRFLGLHSALLSKNGRGVILIGPKEAGKSTLACALWQHGWHLHADDLTILDEEFRPHHSPRRVSLRHSSRELLGEALWQRVIAAPSVYYGSGNLLFHPADLDSDNTSEFTPPELSAIVFLARQNSAAGSAELQKLVPASSVFSFLPYSTLMVSANKTGLEADNSNWGESLPKLSALAAKVPVYDLGRGPLDQMIAQIESLIA